MNFRNNNYYYDGSGHLRSTHYRQYSQPTASSYVDYIDSNYSFTSYNNICDYQLDTLITYKKSGSATTYSPYLKTKRITYPYGGYKMYLLQWNGSSYDSLSIYEKLYDAHGNDSLYYAWQWNSTLHMFKIESHDEYINTYDASFNLMKQLRMSNYQTVNKDSIQPYTKKIFGNYIAGGVVNVVKDYDPNSDYKIYPNPSDGRIHVWMNPEWAQDADMQLYDLTGKMIRHEQLTQPLSDFDLQVQAGLYIMTLQHGDKKII